MEESVIQACDQCYKQALLQQPSDKASYYYENKL
eukprot:CAMPEP_0118681008 /NCGR_PEP_ID=MMETSP0800-20121206/4696_1 /TAXON_ID=210618 ORGANISM="Striatella unipunctata, Strain CCMP2910" /NCGR_SAMPLE_ID=MMETSP0800 /ASSEMBLY_ACC=CAM_ASM_000638 /LENGTH=33 /DNA_ID= /DNA_START= /DNA_END= /DNA_ORIENTATION=